MINTEPSNHNKMTLIETIHQHAAAMPNHVAIQNGNMTISYHEFLAGIAQSQLALNEHTNDYTIALAMDNHPAGVTLDIAASATSRPLVPLPTFFSDTQIMHAVKDAGAGVLLTDNPQRFNKLFNRQIKKKTTIMVMGKRLVLMHLNIAPQALPATTAKITYTSGTTGQPKGVCLSDQAMLNVATSIQQTVNLTSEDQHLCVLPLSTLLENVAGLYAIFLAGGTAHILPSEAVGLSGSSLNITQLHQALESSQANTAIFIPELLSALVMLSESGVMHLPSLRFLAVGGASIAPHLLERAREVGLPVFEGYGLSESASVVALNSATENRVGSVGKVLPHLDLKFSDEHEILVKGASYLGYTNSTNQLESWLDTGDIGYMDEDGYLFINGRKKNIFITSYGRNVSPEWVERDLTSTPEILQACLFGEAKPWNTALLFTKPEMTEGMIDAAIDRINQQLPDYARVSKWLRIIEPFNVENNQLTPNGRLKRNEIWQAYEVSIEAIYENTIKQLAI